MSDVLPPELVILILGSLPMVDLFHASLTCRFWSDVALDLLWSAHPIKFKYLARILGTYDLYMADGLGHPVIVFHRCRPPKIHWQRFLYYCSKIASLTDDTESFGANAIEVVRVANCGKQPLFPRLTHLAKRLCDNTRENVEFLLQMAPNLTAVKLIEDSNGADRTALVNRLLPNLQTIELVFVKIPGHVSFGDATNLKQVKLQGPILSEASWNSLARCARLTQLRYRPDRGDFAQSEGLSARQIFTFHQLETLDITSTALSHLPPTIAHMPNLKDLTVKFRFVVHSSVEDLFRNLVITSPSMHSIRIESLVRNAIPYCILALRLPALRRFVMRLNAFHPNGHVTDALFNTLSREMGNLTYLEVGNEAWCATLSLRSFLDLARNAAQLEELQFYVGKRSIDELDVAVPSLARLRVLSLGVPHLEAEDGELAAFLVRVCPQLIRFTSGSWRRAQGTADWKSNEGLIDAYWRARSPCK